MELVSKRSRGSTRLTWFVKLGGAATSSCSVAHIYTCPSILFARYICLPFIMDTGSFACGRLPVITLLDAFATYKQDKLWSSQELHKLKYWFQTCEKVNICTSNCLKMWHNFSMNQGWEQPYPVQQCIIRYVLEISHFWHHVKLYHYTENRVIWYAHNK